MKKLIFLLSFFVISEASARFRSSYPILENKIFSTYKISVWADPTVGKGIFLFYPEGENLKSDDFIYQIKASPKEGIPEILSALAMKGEQKDGKFTYKATIPFHEAAMWDVRVLVKNKQNGDILLDETLPVEVTPPPGPIRTETLVYLIPLILAIGIWLKVVLNKHKKTTRSQ